MLDPNALVSEQVTVVGVLDPVSQAASTRSTGWVDMQTYRRIAAMALVGVFGASATVDVKLEQATSAAGAGAKDLRAATQLLAAGGNNRQVVVEARDDELDTANAFRYVRLTVTVGTAATLTSGVLTGVCALKEPGTQIATIAQIKSS